MKTLSQIAKNLYLYEDSCNVYVLKSGNSSILIDFGTGKVLEHLEGITVEAILITHHHRDQVQGLPLAVEKGIPIYVPHQEQDLISLANEYWQYREVKCNYNTRQDRFTAIHSIPISGTLVDHTNFEVMGLTFKIIPTPGHTTGSVSIIYGDYCFTGDLLYGPGKVWSLAATQWTYNGGEGIPYTILSLLSLKDTGCSALLPSHGAVMSIDAVDPTVSNLLELMQLRRSNPRLLQLRESPYEEITPHVLKNRTSVSNSYVLISNSGKAMIIDYGYDFVAGFAAGVDRSSRRPWLYTIPALMKKYDITSIDACIPTHYHDDHVAGMNLLRAAYGTTVMCPDIFADILENPTNYDIPCLWYDPIPVDKRVSGKFTWEEYEITLHHLPGHTNYAVAIEFTADGKKFMASGDQYTDADGLFLNYVYKNKTSSSDFITTGELYNAISPDFMLPGHQDVIPYRLEYARKLIERSHKLQQVHDSLLPCKDFGNSFLAEFMPYFLKAKAGGTYNISISVVNPFDEEAEIEIVMHIPDGFNANGKYKAKAAPRQKLCFNVAIKMPNTATLKERIACDVIINGHNHGQQAEMQITINSNSLHG